MSHDVFRFGVAIGLLVKRFDGGHFSAGLWHLDAITQQDKPVIEAKLCWEDLENELRPYFGEPVRVNPIAMKEIEEPIVAGISQSKASHYARDTEKI